MPRTWVFRGQQYSPLPDDERARQRRRLDDRRRAVERYHGTHPLETVEEREACLVACMQDVGFWCEHFAWTFDPRTPQRPHHRFILYDFQRTALEQLLHAIRTGGTMLVEKSRDMGASWLMMTLLTWCWLFDESFHALVGSRKEDLVDDGTVDALFGKIDYQLERQPAWMLQGYDAQRKEMRRKLHLQHPQGNLITGESANRHFGRGPRKNVVYLDEFAFWEDDQAVWTGIGDTAPCRIVTSTPAGQHNMFARIRHDDPTVTLCTLHWTKHPYKDLAWYTRECAARAADPVSIAQELDIDYAASAGGLALPEMTSNPAIVVPRIAVQDASHAEAQFYMGMDWGTRNPSSLHVYRVRQIAPRVYDVVSLWEFYQPSDLPELARVIRECVYYPRLEAIYADPSMWNYTQNTPHGTTTLAYLFRDHYNIHLSQGRRGDQFALAQLREFWEDPEHPRFTITQDCPQQIREFQNLRYETISAHMQGKRNIPEKLVDKDNHCYDEQTDILTQQGWKRFAQLTVQDRVAVWGQDGLLEYEQPEQVVAIPYRGEMAQYQTASVDFCVTPQHRMWVADQMSVIRRKKSQFKRRVVTELHQVMWVQQFARWEGQATEMMDDEVAWFGFWLAEGCKYRNAQGKGFAHCDQRQVDAELTGLMERLGAYRRTARHSGMTRFTLSGRFYELVQDIGRSWEKYIPVAVKQLPERQLHLLLYWMLKGDGTWNAKQMRYNTVSAQLADDVQEVALKCGYVASIAVQAARMSRVPSGRWTQGRILYHVNIRRGKPGQGGVGQKSRLTQIRRDRIKWVPYNGMVYCVTTRSGTVLVRRNGKPMWCGQSWDECKYFLNMRFDAPLAAQPPQAIPLGYDALQLEMQGLKERKIVGLQPRSRRRHFR